MNRDKNTYLDAHIRCEKDKFSLDVTIKLPLSGVISIFGPSGSGKTTFLRCLAGLDTFNGEVTFGSTCWETKHYKRPTHQRNLAYIFQQADLFPHLTVRENIAYAEKRARKKPKIHHFDDIIELLNIGTLLSQSTGYLSGGELQRVAFARALLSQPLCILMDEPLSSLDAQHKAMILPYILKIKEQLKPTIIYVSHDFDEHIQIGDYAVALKKGRIQNHGSLLSLLSSPDIFQDCHKSIAAIVEGNVDEIDSTWRLAKISFPGGCLWLDCAQNFEDQANVNTREEYVEYPVNMNSRRRIRKNQTVRLSVQATDVSIALSCAKDNSIINKLEASITTIRSMTATSSVLVSAKVGSFSFFAQVTQRSVQLLDLSIGKTVWLQIKATALVS